ncbi:MAG TPA: DUF2071 domain-containing protein [Verrucomicrobiae bacterium]|nr:DUF2071 domain-containing protein [Verrucomicrobiae bacterium]
MKADASPVFLTAEWRHLAMLNYEVDPNILAPILPNGTELDVWHGKNFISVVGFRFLNTRVLGSPIPFHRNFEEVNLRFYVRRKSPDGWRRGVVFIKELVPRIAIAWTARAFYHEPYVAVPMSHQIEVAEETTFASYSWRFQGNLNFLKLAVGGEAQPSSAGSGQEFITEHYWGYTAQRDGSTLEYQVEHPPWRVREAATAELHCDIAGCYGEAFGAALSAPPASAFLAEGSAVTVRKGVRIFSSPK